MLQTLLLIAKNRIRTEAPPALTTPDIAAPDFAAQVTPMAQELQRILGRALTIRAVDAGSCNGCELELHALQNPYYNLEGYGIKFVASPRHADLLLVSGPVTRNMEMALRRSYEAMPDPKWVVALGDCGRDGGVFGCSYASCGGVGKVIPVDLTIAGCPPPPLEVLRGILQLLTSQRLAKPAA